MPPAKPVFSVSVREIIAFVLRSGDLGSSGDFASPNRAIEGTRGHQRVQKSRPDGYESEVSVKTEIETDEFILEIKGRIDGLQPNLDSLLIEEIKTVHRPWKSPPDPLHLAQAKLYGWLYARERQFQSILIQVTYLDLTTGETASFREEFTTPALRDFFDAVTSEYCSWVREHLHWRRARDASIQPLPFPFPEYRHGQRTLAVAVYRAIKNRARLFAEAPTGIGKTVSTLFPAIKALGEGRVEKIFYLTAKTVGRAVAEKALADLRAAGLRLRAITLTARDKICFNQGQPCDLKTCPFAIGYHDRIKGALRDAFQAQEFTRPALEELARKHQVCPFEFSLDLALWADAVICDYNYAFDPSVSLKRFFSEDHPPFAILCDEAHNLPARAREMFSADLERAEFAALKKDLAADAPACAKALGKLVSRLSAIHKSGEWTAREDALVSQTPPEKIPPALKDFLKEAELWLVQNQPAPFRQALLEAYFKALGFQRTLEGFNENYAAIFYPDSGRLRLFCLDPSALLRQALDSMGAAIFFSATLRPLGHFRASLGGEPLDPLLSLDSPFPQEHLRLLIQDQVPTRLKARAGSYQAVADAIAALARGRTGNYIAYFPSYDYLREVLPRFQERFPECTAAAQAAGMTESERENFMNFFHPAENQTRVGFAVLGGIFGEGIDLVGERLIGVAIVGVGLPQICLERDLIRARAAASGADGFDQAYTFPGINRVLQAAGRVIRSARDRGVVLLIDERFRQWQYRRLLPPWWNPLRAGSAEEIERSVRQFWSASIPSPAAPVRPPSAPMPDIALPSAPSL